MWQVRLKGFDDSTQVTTASYISVESTLIICNNADHAATLSVLIALHTHAYVGSTSKVKA